MIVFRETDTDYLGADGQWHHMTASLEESNIDAMLTSLTGPVAAAVREWSDGAVQWDIDVRYATRPITSMSSPDAEGKQWVDPESIRDVIDGFSPDGVYDQIMVYWEGDTSSEYIPTRGWGLALPYFPSQHWGYLTVEEGPTEWWNPSEADIWSQVWIHEWLHVACSFYASRGYPMPAGDADGGTALGYVVQGERGLPGWGAYYSDLMQGAVFDNGRYVGITREAWLTGSIRTATTSGATTTTTLPSGPGFPDIGGSPYKTAINDLAGRGIITGLEDGSFRPNSPVTRQQFAKMIVKTLNLPVAGTAICPYGDVALQMGTDPLYPSKYVAVCAASGITQGKTSTTFAPNDDITRQQLITMVARAAVQAGKLAEPSPGYAPSFSPGQFSLMEHFESARQAAFGGILSGLQGVGLTYNFTGPASRGECAQLLYNLSIP